MNYALRLFPSCYHFILHFNFITIKYESILTTQRYSRGHKITMWTSKQICYKFCVRQNMHKTVKITKWHFSNVNCLFLPLASVSKYHSNFNSGKIYSSALTFKQNLMFIHFLQIKHLFYSTVTGQKNGNRRD